MATFSEEIESLNQQLQSIYERAGQLSNHSTFAETTIWVNLRYFCMSGIEELLMMKAKASPERLNEKVPCEKNKASFS